MPSNPQDEQRRREECRREVLGYLAERQALAFPAAAIQRKLRIDGNDFALPEIELAVEFLIGFTPDPLVRVIHDPLGGTKNYKVTTAGVIFHERNS